MVVGGPRLRSPAVDARRPHCRVRLLLRTVSLWLCAASALHVGAARASPAIDLLGGTAPRVISLRLVVVRSAHTSATESSTELQGQLHLPLRNLTNVLQQVRVIYAPDESKMVRVISRFFLLPHTVSMLNLTFPLQSDRPPDALNGTLDFQTFPYTRVHPGGACASRRRPFQACPNDAFALRVSGQVQPLTDLRFSPAAVTVQVTRACPFSCNTTSAGTVHLYGADVPQLVALMRASGRSTVEAQLRQGSSLLGVRMQHLRSDPSHPGQAVAELTLAHKPAPGKYAGTLLLNPLAPSSPGLSIEVHSRIWVVWTIAAILIGVLVAGLLYAELGLRRRKQLLTRALVDAIDRYCARVWENRAPSSGQAVIWNLAVDCRLRECPGWTRDDGLDSASKIYTAIRRARSDADLEEALVAACAFIAGIKTWLLALVELRRLRELARQNRVRPADWLTTKVAQESELLIARAQRAPLDPDEASRLIDQVEMQISWHRRCADAWDLRRQLIDAGGIVRDRARTIPLRRLIESAAPITSRTHAEQDQLDLTLDRLHNRLATLQRDTITPGLRSRVLGHAPEEDADDREAALLRAERNALLDAGSPRAALARVAATTALFGDKRASGTPSVTVEKDRLSVLSRLIPADLEIAALILLITGLIYLPAVYGDTWGSASDWASAFGAGLAGQAVVGWGILPVFRWLRRGSRA